MSQRSFRHLIGAGIGVAAAPSMLFFFLDRVMRTAFLSVAMRTFHVPGLPPGATAGPPLHGVWLAAIELAAAGALAGVVAGAGWVSPVASLVAGLPMLALHFYTHSSTAGSRPVHAPYAEHGTERDRPTRIRPGLAACDRDSRRIRMARIFRWHALGRRYSVRPLA
jgi:hypothetical protein